MNAIRPATDADMRFVESTWAWSHRSRSYQRERRLDDASGRWPIRDEIAAILRKRPVIMVLPGEGDSVHAWACATPGIALHYAYVPKDLRGHGLGRLVIEAAYGSYPARIALSYRHRLDKGVTSTRFVQKEAPWKSRIGTK